MSDNNVVNLPWKSHAHHATRSIIPSNGDNVISLDTVTEKFDIKAYSDFLAERNEKLAKITNTFAAPVLSLFKVYYNDVRHRYMEEKDTLDALDFVLDVDYGTVKPEPGVWNPPTAVLDIADWYGIPSENPEATFMRWTMRYWEVEVSPTDIGGYQKFTHLVNGVLAAYAAKYVQPVTAIAAWIEVLVETLQAQGYTLHDCHASNLGEHDELYMVVVKQDVHITIDFYLAEYFTMLDKMNGETK